MPVIKRPRLLYLGLGQYVTFSSGLYKGRYEEIFLKSGYKTDLTSSPGFLAWFVPSTGTYEDIAIWHDKGCDDQRAAYLARELPPRSSKDVDGLFRRMLRERNEELRDSGSLKRIGLIRRWLMWTAVRWGALFSKHRRPTFGYWPDLPIMLLISLLALPFFIVPVVSVLIVLGLIWTLEMVGVWVRHLWDIIR